MVDAGMPIAANTKPSGAEPQSERREEWPRSHPRQSRHAGDHLGKHRQPPGQDHEPAPDPGEQPFGVRELLRSEQADRRRPAEPAAKHIGERAGEEAAERCDQAADDRSVDETERRHDRGRRDRQDKIGHQEQDAGDAGPATVTGQPGDRAFLAEAPLEAGSPDQKGDQHDQRQEEKPAEKAHHGRKPGFLRCRFLKPDYAPLR